MKKVKKCFLCIVMILLIFSAYYFLNYNKDAFSNKSTKYSTEDAMYPAYEIDSSSDKKVVNHIDKSTLSIEDNAKVQEIDEDVKSETALKNIDENNITSEIKNYILNNQEGKSEADKIKWSEVFLDNLDIKSLYNEYIKSGGDSKNLESFAQYITLNAPILDNWKELFKKELYDEYGEEVISIEQIEGDLYQAKVKLGDKELPYVLVSARTGYFHG